MPGCPYLTSKGKKCGKKVEKNEIVCKKHGGKKDKNQSGGFMTELVYPMGVSVSAATYMLYKINNIVSDWYIKKNKKK